MRINFPRPSNTRHTGTLQPITGRMTGPLYLFEDPLVPLEAATRRYTELSYATLSASSITSGTIAKERLPSFNGDVSVATGTGEVVLANSGVTPGTYRKLTVNAKGLVVSAEAFSLNDVSGFAWNKIISGLPTTLDGYGITDAVPINGGMLTGNLTVQGQVTLDMHAATKEYVDAKALTGEGYKVGDIVSQVTMATPDGFLRLNGSILIKTTYADLYTYIGDTYSRTGLEPGAGQPWRYQYNINTSQSGDITGWTMASTLPSTISETSVVVTKNRVYVIGGKVGSSASNLIYYADINSDGILGTWTLDSNTLPGGAYASHIVAIKNKVYLIGGRYVSGGTHYYGSNIYSASIDSNGVIGAWTTTSFTACGEGNVLITKNKIYIIAYRNSNSGYTNSTLCIPINSDGSLSTFSFGPTLPVAMNFCNMIVTKNRVYLFGGRSLSMDFTTNSYLYSYTAAIADDGTLGTWSTHPYSLPINVSHSATFMTKNTAYIFGGYSQTATETLSTSVVYKASINADGTLGSWSTGTSIPTGYFTGGSGFAVKNYLYLIGSQLDGAVYKAAISGELSDYSPYYDGTLSPTDPDKFIIPNYINKETTNKYYFIKY